MFVLANGLMLCPYNGKMSHSVLCSMRDYMERFHLDSATFQLGSDGKVHLHMSDVLVAIVRSNYRRGLISADDMDVMILNIQSEEITRLRSEVASLRQSVTNPHKYSEANISSDLDSSATDSHSEHEDSTEYIHKPVGIRLGEICREELKKVYKALIQHSINI